MRKLELYLKNDKKLKDLFERNKPYVKFVEEEIYSPPFDVPEPEYFSLPENYPECCEFHGGVPEFIDVWFRKFPNCCDRHSKLIERSWFKRERYIKTPDKIRLQLLYTESHIKHYANDIDWYKKITDYIEFNCSSFGSPEVGCERYYLILEHYIKTSGAKEIGLTEEQKSLLVEYMELDKNQGSDEKTDINILYSTFRKWLKTVPNIGKFADLKNDMNNVFPIQWFLYQGEYNPYLGETKFKTRTRSELISFLIRLTNSIIFLIVDNENYDETTFNKVSIIKEQHKLKQKKLVVSYSKRELKYFKVLKKWLANEKSLFRELNLFANKIDNDKASKKKYGDLELSELRILVSENRIEKAFNKLLNVISSKEDSKLISKQIYHNLGRFKQIEERKNLGTVSSTDYSIEINQIRYSLIELIETL